MLKQMGLNAVYIGFTSPIPISKKVDHRNKKIIHIGGSSPFKGTDLVLETWEKWGDELPPLKVVCRQQCLKNLLKWKPNARVIKNVEIVDEWLEDSEMWSMKLDHSIHLCPSLAEGFGHTINEARALGALVLCTDAPPMNELITPDSGILIPVNTTVDRKNLVSKNYMVSPQGIKDAVLKAWDMTTVQRAELGDKAYRDFILETEAFKLEIKKLARQIY
jgi:glycosyltransferase involved in cell wall biosynthesis